MIVRMPLAALAIGLCVMPLATAGAQEVEHFKSDGVARGFGAPAQLGTIEEFESNNTLAQANSLGLSDRFPTRAGIINLAAADIDYFVVSLAANESIVVVTTPIENTPVGFNRPDTFVRIRNSADVDLVVSDDAGADFPITQIRGSVIRFRAPSAGSYYVRVEGFSPVTSGDYHLMVSRLATDWVETVNDNTALADILGVGRIGPTSGFCGTEGAGTTLDYFRVNLNPGDILISTFVPSGTNFSTPNIRVRLLADDGITPFITSNDDFGSQNVGVTVGCTMRFQAPQAGTYFIEVRDQNDGTFDTYRLVSALIPGRFCPGDADGDGLVSFPDISAVLLNWLNTCP